MSISWESPVLGAVPLEARLLAEGIAAGPGLRSAEVLELCQEWTGERIHAG